MLFYSTSPASAIQFKSDSIIHHHPPCNLYCSNCIISIWNLRRLQNFITCNSRTRNSCFNNSIFRKSGRTCSQCNSNACKPVHTTNILFISLMQAIHTWFNFSVGACESLRHCVNCLVLVLWMWQHVNFKIWETFTKSYSNMCWDSTVNFQF